MAVHMQSFFRSTDECDEFDGWSSDEAVGTGAFVL